MQECCALQVHFDCIYKGINVVSSRQARLLGGNRTISEVMSALNCMEQWQSPLSVVKCSRSFRCPAAVTICLPSAAL